MKKCIIYPNDEGGVSIIYPMHTNLSVKSIASMEVPIGKPYKIIDVSEIPTDPTFRAAWEYEE